MTKLCFYLTEYVNLKDDKGKDVPSGDGINGSFKQQLDYLLTSGQRSQLKKALHQYTQDRLVFYGHWLKETFTTTSCF